MFYHEFGIVVACDHVLMEPICRGEILECKYFMPFNFGLYQRWQINGTHVYIVVVQGGIQNLPKFSNFERHNHARNAHFLLLWTLFYDLFKSILEIMSFSSFFYSLPV